MTKPKVPPLEVLDFSLERLAGGLSNDYCLVADIQRARNIVNLYGYLDDINVKTIVVENQYIDGDYMDDVSNYYVKCFKPYDRYCKRLHFFAAEFSPEQVWAIVLGKATDGLVKDFTSAYKGFIIARPLPVAIIGRTLLATYPDDDGRRRYPCINDNLIHFFGIDLHVESLEFQEQDTILAACATVAVWTTLHRTHQLFHTPIRTPATITRQANEVVFSSRPIPSRGLNVQQINNAILRNDLVAEITHVSADTPLIPLLYSYVQSGLPVILGVEIEGSSEGIHAITVLGYSLRSKESCPTDYRSSEIQFLANRINEFYAHDDQIVPFSRVVIKENQTTRQVYFYGSWTDGKSGKNLKMTPKVVIVPIYHKIRIGFYDVYKWFYYLNLIRPLCNDLTRMHVTGAIAGLQELSDEKVFTKLARLLNPHTLEWDLFLTTITDFKSDIRKDFPTEAEDLQAVFLASHPRFIWRALLKNKNDEILLELLADATDIPRTLPFYRIIWRDKDLQRWLFQLIDNPYIRNLLERSLPKSFVDFLRTH